MSYRKLFGGILFLLIALSTLMAAAETKVLTTFYPMYLLTENITGQMDFVNVANMAEQSVGCLHDYQLQTQDIVALEQADVLVINGGGMEQFMSRVLELRSDLPIIDACEGIALQDSTEEGMLNAHVWLSPRLAAVQVENIGKGLAAADPEHAEAYEAGTKETTDRLAALDETVQEMLEPVRGAEIITFHEAFTYFAEDYGLVVAGVIAHEPGESPSTREVAETCDLVRKLGIDALFVEPQYPQTAAEIISSETGARIFTLDPMVSGSGLPESYDETILHNAQVLLEALR